MAAEIDISVVLDGSVFAHDYNAKCLHLLVVGDGGAAGVVEILDRAGDAIARHVGNYNSDVRSKMRPRKDVYSDNPGKQPGGFVM